MVHMPWQHLKKAVNDLAVRSRAHTASASRSHLKGVEEIDNHIVKKVVASLGQKEQKVYNHISSGGAWADNHLQEIGLSNGKCPHCGQDVDDITHITWQCVSINKHRKNHALKDVDPAMLPTYIKHGVPKAMSTDVQSTYWGEAVASNECNEQTCKAIGVQFSKRGNNIASTKQYEVSNALSNHDIDPSKHNARQGFQQNQVQQKPASVSGSSGRHASFCST